MERWHADHGGDVAFTANTVRDLGLGGTGSARTSGSSIDGPPGFRRSMRPPCPNPGLTAVEAVDDYTVKFTWNFDARPGHLAAWTGPWADHGRALLGATPWSRGRGLRRTRLRRCMRPRVPAILRVVRWCSTPVKRVPLPARLPTPTASLYFDKGREITSGGVTYTVGPFITDQIYSLYGDQSAAVLALKAGEVDYLYNPLGLQRGLLDQITGDREPDGRGQPDQRLPLSRLQPARRTHVEPGLP